MDFSIESFMERYLEAMRGAFAKRIVFAGLRGSFARGEAYEGSNIDTVLILDTLTEEDLTSYAQAVNTLDEKERIRGFIAGKKELYHWEKSELLQFCQDTTAYIGSLKPLMDSLTSADIRRAILNGACKVYDGVIENQISGCSRDVLRALHKTAFLTVQAQYYERKKIFYRQRAELLPLLTGLERLVGEGATECRASELDDATFHRLSRTLFLWSGAVLRGERTDQGGKEAAKAVPELFTRDGETVKKPKKQCLSARRAKIFGKGLQVLCILALAHGGANALWGLLMEPYRSWSAGLVTTLLCYLPFLLIMGSFFLYFTRKARLHDLTHQTPEELFKAYQKLHPEAREYDAYAFCGGGPLADELLALVLSGEKRATTSSKEVYDAENDPLPEPGALSVLLDSKGYAQCIIEMTDVSCCPFSMVTEEYAKTEGEGDKTLAYWKDVHRKVYTKELPEYGLTFTEESPVVLQIFRVVFRADGKKTAGPRS